MTDNNTDNIESKIDYYKNKIIELKSKHTDTDSEIAKIIHKADKELSKENFSLLINNIGYKQTQIKKYKKFYDGINGHTSVLVKKLGVEKYYAVVVIKEDTQREEMLKFTAEQENISVRDITRMKSIFLNNKQLTLDEVYKQAKNPLKQLRKSTLQVENNNDFVPRSELETLQAKYDKLNTEFEKLKTEKNIDDKNKHCDSCVFYLDCIKREEKKKKRKEKSKIEQLYYELDMLKRCRGLIPEYKPKMQEAYEKAIAEYESKQNNKAKKSKKIN